MWFEPVEAGPQTHVRGIRHLRLHAHQVLDLVGGRRLPTGEQMLAREQGSIERALTEDRIGHERVRGLR
jgi:hypothetical protein